MVPLAGREGLDPHPFFGAAAEWRNMAQPAEHTKWLGRRVALTTMAGSSVAERGALNPCVESSILSRLTRADGSAAI